jgi:hypothetical protein
MAAFKPDQRVTLTAPGFEGESVTVDGPYRAPGAWSNEYTVTRSDGSTMAVRGTDMAERGWTVSSYEGTLYRVPETGRDENFDAMLTEIPGFEPGKDPDMEAFTAHAMAFLMQDGNLGVPGGNYGTDTSSCAPIAIAIARIMADASGEPITYYGLDSDMGLVVNSSDDVATTLREHGPTIGIDPADFLEGEQLLDSQELDDFMAGFIECGLWADLVPEEEDPQEYGAGDKWPEWVDKLDDSARSSIRDECVDFMAANLEDLHAYCEQLGDFTGSDSGSTPAAMARAGHDFWLTRNGHGAGFWDRGLGELGDRLSEASKPHGEASLYVYSDGESVGYE